MLLKRGGGQYSDYNGYYYTNPVFKSPFLEELNEEPIRQREVCIRISSSMADVFKWYPVFSLYRDSAKIKKVSLLRNSNEIQYFEEIGKVVLPGTSFGCASIILDSYMQEFPLKIDEKERCIWGTSSYSECIGETFKKGSTGDFQYRSFYLFFYKAFPTNYSFRSFIELLNNKYEGKDKQEDVFWKEYHRSNYYIKTINSPTSLKDFLDKYDFTYVGCFSSDI